MLQLSRNLLFDHPLSHHSAYVGVPNLHHRLFTGIKDHSCSAGEVVDELYISVCIMLSKINCADFCLRWLDTTPTSRVIARCTQDIQAGTSVCSQDATAQLIYFTVDGDIALNLAQLSKYLDLFRDTTNLMYIWLLQSQSPSLCSQKSSL